MSPPSRGSATSSPAQNSGTSHNPLDTENPSENGDHHYPWDSEDWQDPIIEVADVFIGNKKITSVSETMKNFVTILKEGVKLEEYEVESDGEFYEFSTIFNFSDFVSVQFHVNHKLQQHKFILIELKESFWGKLVSSGFPEFATMDFHGIFLNMKNIKLGLDTRDNLQLLLRKMGEVHSFKVDEITDMKTGLKKFMEYTKKFGAQKFKAIPGTKDAPIDIKTEHLNGVVTPKQEPEDKVGPASKRIKCEPVNDSTDKHFQEEALLVNEDENIILGDIASIPQEPTTCPGKSSASVAVVSSSMAKVTAITQHLEAADAVGTNQASENVGEASEKALELEVSIPDQLGSDSLMVSQQNFTHPAGALSNLLPTNIPREPHQPNQPLSPKKHDSLIFQKQAQTLKALHFLKSMFIDENVNLPSDNFLCNIIGKLNENSSVNLEQDRKLLQAERLARQNNKGLTELKLKDLDYGNEKEKLRLKMEYSFDAMCVEMLTFCMKMSEYSNWLSKNKETSLLPTPESNNNALSLQSASNVSKVPHQLSPQQPCSTIQSNKSTSLSNGLTIIPAQARINQSVTQVHPRNLNNSVVLQQSQQTTFQNVQPSLSSCPPQPTTQILPNQLPLAPIHRSVSTYLPQPNYNLSMSQARHPSFQLQPFQQPPVHGAPAPRVPQPYTQSCPQATQPSMIKNTIGNNNQLRNPVPSQFTGHQSASGQDLAAFQVL